MKRGLFIVVDGIGGSGKTTQLELLKKHFPPETVFTHEPGGSPRSEKIRSILKEGEGESLDAFTDFFLFWAARAEHMANRIRPSLDAGKIVVSDRFDSSTYAMQVRGEDIHELDNLFWQCRDAVMGRYAPDCYIILDVDTELAHTRREGRRDGEDRFDERNDAYQKRVRNGYREFADRVGPHAHIINANRSPDENDADIWRILEPLIH